MGITANNEFYAPWLYRLAREGVSRPGVVVFFAFCRCLVFDGRGHAVANCPGESIVDNLAMTRRAFKRAVRELVRAGYLMPAAEEHGGLASRYYVMPRIPWPDKQCV